MRQITATAQLRQLKAQMRQLKAQLRQLISDSSYATTHCDSSTETAQSLNASLRNNSFEKQSNLIAITGSSAATFHSRQTNSSATIHSRQFIRDNFKAKITFLFHLLM
jgi:hypothetical protein